MRTMSENHISSCINHSVSKAIYTASIETQVLLITPHHMLVIPSLSASVKGDNHHIRQRIQHGSNLGCSPVILHIHAPLIGSKSCESISQAFFFKNRPGMSHKTGIGNPH